MDKRIIKEMKCPFCDGTGTCTIPDEKEESRDMRELIARVLKKKGMFVWQIAKWMGYKSDRSVSSLLDRGSMLDNDE